MAAKKKKGKSYFVFLLIAVLTFMALYIFFNDKGILSYIRLKNDIEKIKTEIADTEKRIKNLEEQIDSLSESDYTIEKTARERYFMQKPNEQVFSIEKDTDY